MPSIVAYKPVASRHVLALGTMIRADAVYAAAALITTPSMRGPTLRSQGFQP